MHMLNVLTIMVSIISVITTILLAALVVNIYQKNTKEINING